MLTVVCTCTRPTRVGTGLLVGFVAGAVAVGVPVIMTAAAVGELALRANRALRDRNATVLAGTAACGLCGSTVEHDWCPQCRRVVSA